MSQTKNRKDGTPMSLKLPEDLKGDLEIVAKELGETTATVARMSMRHGLKTLLETLKTKRPEMAA